MATTTNYGWTTPDDTSLVKDGASAIRSLGSSIDTTTKNLNPSTTLGDIEYRSATANTNTRVPIGTSGQALTVVAGVPSWAASATSVLTTTGDLLYASAANTLARRGIGTTGQVLTVSGGLPTWATPSVSAKSWTLLNAGGTTLTGAQTVTVSGISGKEDILVIVMNAIANASSYQYIRPNGIGSSYVVAGHRFSFPATYNAGNYDGYSSTTELGILLARQENSTTQGVDGSAHITGGTSTGNKSFWSVGCARAGASQDAYSLQGIVPASAAITSISIYSDSGNFTSGTVYVYGA